MDARLAPLYTRYLKALRPIVIEYESREERFVEPLLTDVPFMFDNVAAYIKTGAYQNLERANNHLENAVHSVQEVLLASLINSDKVFRSQVPVEFRQVMGDGKFISKYEGLEKSARAAIERGDYDRAIAHLHECECLRENNKGSELSVSLLKDSTATIVVKALLTVLVSVLAGVIVYML